MKLKRNRLRVVGILVSIFILMIVSSLYIFQEKIIFLPTKLPQETHIQSPYPYEEIFLTNPDDGARIHAMYYTHKHPKGVILYFHGNAGNLERWSDMAEELYQKGYDVYIMDYRGYGKSKGKFDENAMNKDAQLCYDFISQRYASDSIVLYGRSLGCAFASYIAAHNPAKEVLLETPFYSLEDVVKKRYTWVPLHKLLRYSFPNHVYLEQTSSPIHIFHGDEDRVVPFSSGKELYQYLQSKNKTVTLYEITGGSHNNLIEFEYFNKKRDSILQGDSIKIP